MADEDRIRREQERLAALKPNDLQPAKLPSGIGGRALVFAVRHIFTLLRIALPFLVALAILYLLIVPQLVDVTFGYEPGTALLLGENPYAILAIELIETAVFATAGAVFAVAVHRWIVLGARPASGLYFRLTKAELKFGILTALVALIWNFPYILGALIRTDFSSQYLSILGSLASIPGNLWPWILIPLLIVVALLVPRLSLMFPHVAATGKFSPALSWAAMRGKYVSWLGIFLILNILLAIFLSGIELLTGALDANVLSRLLSVEDGRNLSKEVEVGIQALRGLLILAWAAIAEAANIAALSFIYQEAVKPQEAALAEDTAG